MHKQEILIQSEESVEKDYERDQGEKKKSVLQNKIKKSWCGSPSKMTGGQEPRSLLP